MTILLNVFLCVYRNMITRRMAARRVAEERVNEEIPPQVEQVEQVL